MLSSQLPKLSSLKTPGLRRSGRYSVPSLVSVHELGVPKLEVVVGDIQQFGRGKSVERSGSSLSIDQAEAVPSVSGPCGLPAVAQAD